MLWLTSLKEIEFVRKFLALAVTLIFVAVPNLFAAQRVRITISPNPPCAGQMVYVTVLVDWDTGDQPSTGVVGTATLNGQSIALKALVSPTLGPSSIAQTYRATLGAAGNLEVKGAGLSANTQQVTQNFTVVNCP